MPTIKERLQEDWKTAMKAKDKFKANVLSTAKSSKEERLCLNLKREIDKI